MTRSRCECGRPALAFAFGRRRGASRNARNGRPCVLKGHWLCVGCWRKYQDRQRHGMAAEPTTLLASLLKAYCSDRGYPEPVPEHAFHADRKWRFDFCWPTRMVALEIEGVTREGGRHQRIKGFEADIEKYNEAELSGWTLLRVTPRMVKRGDVYGFLDRALGADRPHPG